MNNVIVIDAGHGGEDPGTSFESVTEKRAALETALTIKFLLSQAGYRTYLTRSEDIRPTYSHRVKPIPGTLCYVSVHYNMPKSYGLVYYETEDFASLQLAIHLAREAGLSRLWASNKSNHAGLYIDNVDPPAVMYEVAAIDQYPVDGEEAKEFRLHAAWAVVRAILRWEWEKIRE